MNAKSYLLVFFVLALFVFTALPVKAQSFSLLNGKSVYLTNVDYTLSFALPAGSDSSQHLLIVLPDHTTQTFFLSNQKKEKDGTIRIKTSFRSFGAVTLTDAAHSFETKLRVIPGWLSILPPLVAIALALITRQVLLALFAGVWIGATFIFSYNPFTAFLNTLTEYIGKAPAQPDRTAILIFSLALGGMVGVISKCGGTHGIVQILTRFASNRKRGQVATWLMGVLIFFDDYANTLIVGNTMRPLTDKLKISREKLSFLVDCTAAPITNIAIISTWIGYEISLIAQSFQQIGLDQNAYITFIKTIPLNFYPIYALVFALAVAILGRDFFSMHKAEQRAANGDGVSRSGAVPLMDVNSSELTVKEGAPLRWYNALIPVSVVILVTLLGLWFDGLMNTDLSAQELRQMDMIRYISTVIGNSDSLAVLMWAAFIGSFVAIIMAVAQKILNVNEAILAWVGGVKSMVMAALILTLAWAIGNICADVQTADYVITITRGFLSAHYVPLVAFIIAGIISFATGTSWGTMAILIPIVVPLSHQLVFNDPSISAAAQQMIFISSLASVLAGATFGDHCSPISDTTIMSSMASGADHIDHVRTQFPYAAMAAGFAIVFGYLPAGFGLSSWINLTLGVVFIFLLVRFAGKKVVMRL